MTAAEDGWTSLFSGKNLDGWSIKCRPQDKDKRGYWKVENGAITETDICGELSELATGIVAGRSDATAITLFKSVGTALEDLAAGELAMRNFSAN